MTPPSLIAQARFNFHAHSLAGILTKTALNIPSNADKSSGTSVRIASKIFDQISEEVGDRLVGQTSGRKFEIAVHEYLEATFPHLTSLRPGQWRIRRLSTKSAISEFAQYEHLMAIVRLIELANSPDIRAAMGDDYLIAPDVIIARTPEEDDAINIDATIVDAETALRTSIRARNNQLPLLHASISCKWTLRSDRAQNARTEALNLLRNRKGPMPHAVCVTGEPMPTRLASLAQGTGDLDCVYHIALPELINACDGESEEMRDTLHMLVEGKRLRDISDLPLDLAI